MQVKDIVDICHDEVIISIERDYGFPETLWSGTKAEFAKQHPEFRRQFLADYTVDYILPEIENELLVYIL